MKSTPSRAKRAAAGRPRTNSLPRAEQLRRAKRAQRERDAKAGQTEARIRLPNALAKRFQFASQQAGFIDTLSKAVDSEVVEVDSYPQLKLLCWNRRSK